MAENKNIQAILVVDNKAKAVIADALDLGGEVPAFTGTYTYNLTENGKTTTIEIKDMKATSNISITVDVPTPTVSDGEQQ